MSPVILYDVAQHVCRIRFNRPEVRNAFDGSVLSELLQALKRAETDPQVRVVVLSGVEGNFQAGADLKWSRAVSQGSEADNLDASVLVADALEAVNEFPKPVVALIEGFCLGGGVAIAAAADIVVAAEDAVFSVAEVRWGLHAGVGLKLLADAVGVRQARRYALTAERFDARVAHAIGLVHVLCPAGELETAGDAILQALAQGAPRAQALTKRILLESSGSAGDPEATMAMSRSQAETRMGAETREGFAAFVEKRRPDWRAAAEPK